MGTENYKKMIILFSVLAVGIIAITFIFAFAGDEKKPTGKQTKDDSKVGTEKEEDSVVPGKLMMITGVDLDSSIIYAFDTETGEEKVLGFTGGSDIRTKGGRVISASQLKKGNIAMIDYDENDRVVALRGADNVWTYRNIRKLKIDGETRKIETGNSAYRMNNGIKVLNKDEFVPIDSLEMNGTDMVDLYGIDNIVYLIKVVSGHGYLTLSNEEDFLGGTLYYGIGKSAAVEEGMKLMLPEGEQEITIEKDDCTANAVIRIANGEETCFDLMGYGPEPVEYGEVVFSINPEGSLLYIDGVKTLWDKPVQLTLGYHQIEAELGGYIGYTGSIEVASGSIKKNISLSPAPTEIPDDTLYEDYAATVDTGNDSNGPTDAPDSADLTGDLELGIPDNTSTGNDDGDLEVVDGDDTGNTGNSGNNGNTGNNGNSNNESSGGGKKTDTNNNVNPDNITVIGDDGDDEVEEENNTREIFGEMTVYCSDGTEVYLDDIYKGRIANGSLTFAKPVGLVELKLVKQGYVTKKYTLDLDREEENSTFRFPNMTPES